MAFARPREDFDAVKLRHPRRTRDGKVWPPPAPSVVVASDNFRDDAKPADLPSG